MAIIVFSKEKESGKTFILIKKLKTRSTLHSRSNAEACNKHRLKCPKAFFHNLYIIFI